MHGKYAIFNYIPEESLTFWQYAIYIGFIAIVLFIIYTVIWYFGDNS